MSTNTHDALLEVKGLETTFFTDDADIKAVDGADLTIRRGRTLCVVGESGCGKSITARSILQLIDPPGKIVAGEILLHRNGAAQDRSGKAHGGDHSGDHSGANGSGATLDLAAMDPKGKPIRSVRGRDISMIFQEPMASLSLVHRVGKQIIEAIRIHNPMSKPEARERAVDLLGQVGIPSPARIVDTYPFELSGGMRQRVMIAMALSCEPDLLIADEPTTALDVTTQAQIMDLLRELQTQRGMAVMFITHDMGVVAEMADDVAVMYLGAVVEKGPVDDIFHDPKHPYTRALLQSIPKLGAGGERERLPTIQGTVPDPAQRPSGCVFRDRCGDFMPGRCDEIVPPPVQISEQREVRCLLYSTPDPAGAEARQAEARQAEARQAEARQESTDVD